MAIDVIEVSAEVVRPLRAEVLRPGLPFEESFYPTDGDAFTTHVAVWVGTEVVAVGTLFPEPRRPGARESRIRGMAVKEGHRSRGYGGAILSYFLNPTVSGQVDVIWCNARERAVPFYERHGYSKEGEAFELPHIGRHFVMSRLVRKN